jgi:hypothetical protein
MKTEKLIDALVADRAAPARPIGRALAGALIVGGLASLVLFLIELGVRTDLAPALQTWRFDLKIVLLLVALAAAFGLSVALSRPATSGHPMRRLLPLAVLAVVAVAIELAVLPQASWAGRLVGSNAMICLVAIPVLSLAPLAAALVAMRAGAPASPVRAGAAAGLLAATAGATLYAFHCFDDSPLFVVTWYTLAAIPVILLGALVGHRLLRW